MDLTKFFLHFRRPRQFIYGGENYVEIYQCEKKGDRLVTHLDNFSLPDLDAGKLDLVKQELKDVETGIILGSGPFIFNIFEFDKIPYRENLRRDLVEWRLQKVFPEDIEQYRHDFFRVHKNRMMSVLVRKDLKDSVEDTLLGSGINVVYLGNSTVEIIDNLPSGNASPDFFIETDGNLTMVVFLAGGAPYYIRKFRVGRNMDPAAEIEKTVNYVKSNYNREPKRYLLSANSSSMDTGAFKAKLVEAGFDEVPQNKQDKIFLPR